MADECYHLEQRRYGRVGQTGDAVIERRCHGCGRTLANGRVERDSRLVAIPGGDSA